MESQEYNFNQIYISENNTTRKLNYETIEKYITIICSKMNVGHLDIKKISDNVYPKLKKINTIHEVNNQIVMSASEMITDHYDYPAIATWILVNDLHQNTHDDYLKVAEQLYSNTNKKGKKAPIVSKNFLKYVRKHYHEINSVFRYERDYSISIFGYRTLERAYLKKLVNGKIVERPQHMYMRIAIALHYRSNRIDKIIETYDLLSQGYFTHATPTLFNAGTTHEQLSSCFLLGIDDSMEEIGECWKDCAIISKYAGGIGIHMTNVRVQGAYIHSTQGTASGLRVSRIFNEIARYADQSGKRAGSIAIYIEPWHGDIFFFLDLKKNTGAETERARDLFLALMVNDIFMKRVEEDGVWSLMCPSECPDLINKYGDEFTKIYEKYENEGKFIKQIKARDLWFKIMESQIETGVPYIIYKDAANKKSNQKNIGVINGSNLCVSGDTMILTSEGYVNIKSVENKKIQIWNGKEFSPVKITKTGSNQPLLKIEFSNGSVLKCTPYHKFYLTTDGKDYIVKEAKDLVNGDRLIKTNYPTIHEGKSYAWDCCHEHIPIDGDLKSKIDYLKYGGLFQSYVFPDKFIELGSHGGLTKMKYLLQTLGCDPVVKKYDEDRYQLIMQYHDVKKLLKLGLDERSIDISKMTKTDDIPENIVTIEAVSELAEKEDTYCFTEHKRHMGIFNGIIGGQCAEILEVSSASEYSVCNLCSICLPKFIESVDGKIVFNYQKLFGVTRVAARNLNNIIDINFYPVDKARVSNLKHRPIGIGIQGLADIFAIFRIPFDSELARDLNRKIFETIYFGALTESMSLAKESGPYETFFGSPLSQGKFQFDLWGMDRSKLSGMWNWDELMEQIRLYGVRNSLVTTCMPTASTSQIQGNNECLVGNTKLYLSCGLTKNIEDFEKNDIVVGWNKKKLENSFCYEKINKGTKKTIDLTFEDGRKITCTSDHKFLTYDKKWIMAKNININTRIMAGIDGTYDKNYGDEKSFVLKSGDYIFTMDSEEERYKTLAFARILGYVYSNDNIYYGKRNQVSLYMGCKYDLECIKNDIIILHGLEPCINDNSGTSENRELCSRLSRSPEEVLFQNFSRTFRIRLNAKLTKAIVLLDNIVNQKAKLPNFILDDACPKSVIREFLAGHFGGDGHAPSLSRSAQGISTLRGIKLSHSINKKYAKSMTEFMENINKLMIKLGMPSSVVHNKLSSKDTVEVRLSVPTGTKFLELLGFRYCIEKMLRLTAANAYWRYKETIFGKRTQMDVSVIDFFEKIKCLDWFDHHKYIIKRNSQELPYFGLRLVDKNTGIKTQVWDINVKYNHSFIANGIVVHNCIEPYTENIYSRSTLAGDFYIINKHLMKTLMEIGLWNNDVIDMIKYYEGSIQEIPGIPDDIKKIFRTSWEIPQKSLIEMSADRGQFIDQTQSLNIFIAKPNFAVLNSCLFYGWKLGLKTGIYYLRSKAASEANQFGIDIIKIKEMQNKHKISKEQQVCEFRPKHLRKNDVCDLCSS